MAAATDQQLMELSQRGDAAAFAEIVTRWQAPVARLVAQLLGPRIDVEDLCQEVFVRVLRARDRYRPSHAFSTWMYRIALNVARDFRRRQARRPQTCTASQDLPAPALPAIEALARNEEERAVAAALAALPDDLREILVLKHFGHLSAVDIGLVMNLPPSTVKSRLQAALKRLRGELLRRGLSHSE
ncbi:MAG TPA: sigma-70 family RNA polymerase sigma factor [Pirellulales bacterium]|nr:sigma-70 family RNA polymerase sigma factor [Pirellulales bacterium]